MFNATAATLQRGGHVVKAPGSLPGRQSVREGRSEPGETHPSYLSKFMLYSASSAWFARSVTAGKTTGHAQLAGALRPLAAATGKVPGPGSLSGRAKDLTPQGLSGEPLQETLQPGM